MSNDEEIKRKIDDLHQKHRAQAEAIPWDPQAFEAWKQAHAQPGPYRLELVYDTENHLLILSGDQAGMKNLLAIVERLSDPETVNGAHIYLDSKTNLTRADLDLIIMRINEEETK